MSTSVESTRRLRVVALEGSAYDRGRAHGAVLRDEIHAVLEKTLSAFGEQVDAPGSVAMSQFLSRTDFVPAIRRWTPDLLDEVEGIAAGAAIAVDAALFLQLADELTLAEMVANRCSTAALVDDGHGRTILGQNMDIEPWLDGFQVVFHHAAAGKRAERLVLSHAGCVALNGVSAAGIGICCNSLTSLRGRPDGLPVACIVRGVLDARSVAAAVELVGGVTHASGQAYTIAGPGEVHGFECSGDRVVAYEPMTPGRFVHTNHPVANDDLCDRWRRVDISAVDHPGVRNTVSRLETLERHLGVRADVETLREALGSTEDPVNPVCRADTASASFTFASTIATFGDAVAWDVAPGPPDRHPYERLELPT